MLLCQDGLICLDVDIYVTERSPIVMRAGGVACRGMLDFVEYCGLDVTLH